MPHLLADFAIIRYAIPLPETRNLTSNPTLLLLGSKPGRDVLGVTLNTLQFITKNVTAPIRELEPEGTGFLLVQLLESSMSGTCMH